MARYRKIDPRVWNDEKFRTLSDRGKLAFLFVLTHPAMTCLGAMRATFEGLAAELRWPFATFVDAIGEGIAHTMIEANRDASFIGLPNFLKYNEPEGPNSVTKAWPNALDLIPECHEKGRLLLRCRTYLEAKSEEFRGTMGDTIWNVLAIPSAILEQEQQPEPGTTALREKQLSGCRDRSRGRGPQDETPLPSASQGV